MITFDMTPRFKEKAVIRKFSNFRNGKLIFELRSSLISVFSAIPPTILTSLVKAWAEMKPPPVGILDQLVSCLCFTLTEKKQLSCYKIKEGSVGCKDNCKVKRAR
jgi:hypothetical protein